MKYTIIKPRKKWELGSFKELWSFRGVFFVLLVRDIKLKYQQTALGIFWVILQPLFISIMFAWIFSRVVTPQTQGIPYLPFAYAAMMPWNFFSQSVQKASQSIVSNTTLVTKVYFPRLVIPFATICSGLCDLTVCLLSMFVMLFIYSIPLTMNIFMMPLLILLLIGFSLSLGVFFSALVVYYRDFGHILPFAFQIMMYLSPILYTTAQVPQRWKIVYCLNPFVGIVEGFRWSLLGYQGFPSQSICISLSVIVFLLFISMIIFKRMERHFADVI